MFKKIKGNLLFVFMFLCLSIGTLFTVFAQNDSSDLEKMFLKSDTISINDIDNIALNKVIIVGDSRMEFLLNDDDVIKPVNFIFDVKSGASFEWFDEVGEPKLKDILDNRDLEYHYQVVFNLGVNDIQYDNGEVEEIFDKYIGEYKKLVLEYDDVDFYFLSVNPIDEELLNKSQPYNVRTNEEIEELNDNFKNAILKFNNFKYCDAYNNLEFLTDDGIHYLSKTSQDILDYIARRCVVYK